MPQSLGHVEPLLRAEREALFHQVDRLLSHTRTSMKFRARTQAAQGAHQGIRGGEHLREALLPAEGQRADVLARALRVDRVEVVDRRRAERLEDERQLVVV